MKCCDITPGMLRHTVSVQRPTITANGSGGHVKTWATIYTMRAGVKNSSGMERVTADRVDATRNVKFTARYNSNIHEGDRIVFNSLAHNIRFIDNIEYANRWVVITCDQGVAT